MKYYNFLVNEQQIAKFCCDILPRLYEDEVFIVALIARRKYVKNLQIKKQQVQKKIIKNHDDFLPTLRQFNCQYGAYLDKYGQHIPEEAFAIYSTLTPCRTTKAMTNLIGKFSENLFELTRDNSPQAWRKIKSIHQSTISEIQKSTAKKCFIDVDFDVVDKQLAIKYLLDFIDVVDKYFVIETRGGYHVLLPVNLLTNEVGYLIHQTAQKLNEHGQQEFGKKFEIIINKQNLIPIPGTKQGGFPVVFWK